ncbi:MAG: sugar phosphate isomerase/epimerase family protein [Planctomycetaceae bacterium]
MPPLSRRTMLGLAAGVATTGRHLPAAGPRPGRLRTGVNAYTFLEPLTARQRDPAQGIDLFDVVDIAARLGIDAVDMTGYFFPGYPDPPADEFVNRLKRHAQRRGVDISGTGIRNDFATADTTVREQGVRLAQAWIEAAARLGAPVLRVFAGPQKPHRTWQEAAGTDDRRRVEGWMADAIGSCAEHGARFGVQVGVQNHADFVATGAEHLSLIDRVAHEWCGALVDTGSYRAADPYAEIATAAPRAISWQVKETLGSRLDSPRADIGRIVRIAHDAGYRGYLPIETLAMGRLDYEPEAALADILGELRAAIAAVD